LQERKSRAKVLAAKKDLKQMGFGLGYEPKMFMNTSSIRSGQ
jgi:hypothetical protein